MRFQKKHLAWIVAASFSTSNIVLADELDSNIEVITVSGFQESILTAPASITVIDKAEIENKGFVDVAQVLQDVPGVFAESGAGRKGGSSEVYVRGMSSKYTLILVNGKPQGSRQGYYNGHGKGNEFGWLPPLSSVERIEVVKGPMSSLYGSDALGGVINVITKRSAEKWQGELSVETILQDRSDAGDFNQFKYFVTGPTLSENVLLTLNGTYSDRDEDKFKYGYKSAEKHNHSAKVDWFVSQDQSLTVEYGIAKQEQAGTDGKSGKLSLETERDFFSMSHDIDWGGFDTQSFFQTEEMENLTQQARYKRSNFKTTTHIPLDTFNLIVGGEYRNQETENPVRAKNKANLQRSDMALFGESHWDVNDWFNLTAGIRWVDDEHYGSEFVPRLYGVYELNEEFVLKAGISEGFRSPDLKQGDSNWVEGGGGRRIDGADIGNSNLKPETSTNAEIALNWINQEGYSAGVTLYNTSYDQAIQKNIICQESSDKAYDCDYLGVNYQRIYQYENVGDADLMGVESFASYSTDLFDVSLNYTYSDSEIQSGKYKGEPLNNLPKHLLNLSGSMIIFDGLNVWSKVKYRSDTIEDGDSQIPNYTIADLGVNYRINDYLNVYGSIYNVFDKQISYEEYRRVLDGRRMSLGVKFQF